MAGTLEGALMALHDRHARSFFAHQQALLDRRFDLAATWLADYREQLAAHMRDEEGVVLPAYVAAGGDATDAPAKLFLGEHARMREFLADFAVRLDRLRAAPDDHRLLELLDRQATYKNLLLHHDLRERNGLYPFLGARLDAERQRRLLAACTDPGVVREP
jgi:hemerythrin-like domain-containing protein